MAALPGYKASIYATTTPSVAFTNEATTDAGDHQHFTITNSLKRFWDQSVSLVVQSSPDGVTWTTITTYTANLCGGIITLNSVLSGSTPSVRVSGNYLPFSLIGDANQVEINNTLDILESTSFNTVGWKSKTANLVGTEIKLDRWWVDHYFAAQLTTQTLFVLVCYSGANANQRYEAFGYGKADALKFDIKALLTESLTFDVHGPLNAYLS